MLGTIFEIDIAMIKKNFSFHWKDQGQHLYKLFISICLNHAWNDLKFYKLWASFLP